MKKILEFFKKPKNAIISGIVLAVIIASVIAFGWIGLWYDALLAVIVGIALSDIKKHSLAKIICIIILLVTIISYILPGRSGIEEIGIADLLSNYFSIILANFSYIILFILVIGGFYGVLNKTPAYKKLLDNIVTFTKPMSKKVVYLIIVFFAIVTALTGITIPLFIFIPFVVSIILLFGYDKLVALSATVGSIVVGYAGGLFVNFVNPNTYEVNTFETLVGLDSHFANALPKLLLLLLGIATLIYFVNRHIKNVEEKKVKYELSDNTELLIAEVKGSYKDIKTWPLVVILFITFAILVIGMIPWNSLFQIDAFSKFHTWLLGLKIKDFSIFGTLVSSKLPALGEWSTSGNLLAAYIYASMLILFMTCIIALINKMKFNETIDAFLEGSKKMFPIVINISLAYTVLVCAYNNGFLETVISNYGKFNYSVSALLALLGCILNVDTIWIIAGVFTPIINLITDEAVLSSVAILLQGIYGIVLLAGPTSLLLIIGLTYLDIPYTTWLKYIWRFILALIIIVVIVTLLVTML